MRILKGHQPNPVTINLIKERMLDKMSNASMIVDCFVLRELVDRKLNLNDRRALDISINEKGYDILSKLDKELIFD